MTPHEVLGVPANATPAEIKRAFRRLAFRTHPDQNPGDPGAAKRFAAVRSAYEALMLPDAQPAARRRESPARKADPPRPTDEEFRRMREEFDRLREVIRREKEQHAHSADPRGDDWWSRNMGGRYSRTYEAGR